MAITGSNRLILSSTWGLSLPPQSQHDQPRVLRRWIRTNIGEVRIQRDERTPFSAAHRSDIRVAAATELLAEHC